MNENTPAGGNRVNWELLAGLLALVAITGTALVHGHALNIPHSHFDQIDISSIIEGYKNAQERGTAEWWTGQWIHTKAPYFRPLSSYIHYAQCWLLFQFGERILTLGLMAQFATICTLVGILAYQVTSRRVAALAATAGATLAGRGSYWMAFWPIADNLTVMTFTVSSCCAWVVYLRGGRWPMLAVTCALFVAGVLSKEQGLVIPLVLALLAAGLPSERRRNALVAAGAMLALAGVLFWYGRWVNNGGQSGNPSFANIWLAYYWNRVYWPFSFAAAFYLAVTGAVTRGRWWWVGSLVAVILGGMISPREGLPPGVYPLIYLLDYSQSLFADAWRVPPIFMLHWLWRRQLTPLKTLMLCSWVCTLPATISGSFLFHQRVIFVWPFWAVIGGFVAVLVWDAWQVPHIMTKGATRPLKDR